MIAGTKQPPTMTESVPASQLRTKLSRKERLYILRTVTALVSQQFDQLLFALNPPKGIVPPASAPQGDRSKALLDWVESPAGPGLAAVEEVLQDIIPTAAETVGHFIGFTITGNLGDCSPADLEAVLQILRQITGDDSITLICQEKGSIKLVLSGSSEGLEKLQELFESGELASALEEIPTECVQPIDNDTTETRKARLIQVVRLRTHGLARARDLARTFARTHDLVNDLARTSDLASDFARTSDLARDLVSDLVSAHDLARDLAHDLARPHGLAHNSNLTSDLDLISALARARARALARDLARTSDLANDSNLTSDLTSDLARTRVLDITRARTRVRDHTRALSIYLVSARDLARSLVNDLVSNQSILDLSEVDLSGANLRGLDLRWVRLTGTNLTHAIVEGTLFRDNPGLTEADKVDLVRRGAIF